MQNEPLAIDQVTETYPDFAARLSTVLCPKGVLETLFAREIIRLSWRLEQPEITEEFRAGATVSIRRDLAELRRLQTDRHLKEELGLNWPGLVSVKEVLRVRKLYQQLHPQPNESGKLQNEPNSPGNDATESSLHTRIEAEQQELFENFTKRTQSGSRSPAPTPLRPAASSQTGRNEPCPCGSSQKYKRCCGHWSRQRAA